jgi:hypothetical protein
MKKIVIILSLLLLWSCWTNNNLNEKLDNDSKKKIETLESSNLWGGLWIPEEETWQR